MLARERRSTTLPTDHDDPPQRPKMLLFCQTCGRRGSPDEWLLLSHEDGTALVCPDCDSRLTVRP